MSGKDASLSWQVTLAQWPEDADSIRSVRHRVFVVEQNIPSDLEWDGRDRDCHHALARTEQGDAIGTARLLDDGHIGRMAVLAPWRRRGIGAAMLELLIQHAMLSGFHKLELSSQQHAVAFYEQYGFNAAGEGHMEAGIPHQHMIRILHQGESPA